MFRSKVSSILQTIVNRSSYNIGHTNLLPCRFLSTDVSHRNSTDTSNETSNITNNECLANASAQSEDSNKTLKESDDTVKALSGALNEGGTSLGDSSIPTEAEVDKLFKKVEVEVRGNDHAVLESYGQFAVMAAEHLDITVGRNIALRKPIHERLTLLKSVHVHKKHRVQYESRTYYRYLDFFHLTGSTADTFLEYIQRNLPEGVAMKVTKVELQNLPDTVQPSSPVPQ